MCLIVAAAALVGLGCAGPLASVEAPLTQVAPDRLVAIPAIVDVYTVDHEDHIDHPQDWAGEAQTMIDAAIGRRMSSVGARAVPAGTLAQIGRGAVDYGGFRALCKMALIEISWWPLRKVNARSVREWSLHKDFSALSKALNTDYVFISLFVSGSKHLTLLQMNGHGGPGPSVSLGWTAVPVQLATGCIVDLRNGAVVGCAMVDPEMLAIRNRRNLEEVVDKMVEALLAPADPSAPPVSQFRPDERDQPLPSSTPHEELIRLTDIPSHQYDQHAPPPNFD